MDKAELYSEIDKVNHSREKLNELANLILLDGTSMSYLLQLAFTSGDPGSIKAGWVLEIAVRVRLVSLLPYIDPYLRQIAGVTNETGIRTHARICEYLVSDYFNSTDGPTRPVLKPNHLECITTVCFDWLIGDHKVAAKVYSMGCLLLLGRKFAWIHPELRQLLEQNYGEGSAAYKARARFIFNQLDRGSKLPVHGLPGVG